MWTARRILKELADTDRRRTILAHFWRHAEAEQRLLVQMQLAKAMHFREETIRKMTPEKKADLLASRIASPELEQFLELALMQYHTRDKKELMAAFLDYWHIPHDQGSIEVDDYPRPTADQVREAVQALEGQFDRDEIRLYLATAGLLMADEWRDGTWPVVDEMV
jgi:D-hexose-6-phosphate mutarotase